MKEFYLSTEYRNTTEQKMRDFHELLTLARRMLLDLELHVNSLVGERFGELVVKEKINSYSLENAGELYRPQWLCACDCGTELVVDHLDLIDKKITSCHGHEGE